MDSSKARTEQPPTASYQLPSPQNHKLTIESKGEKENKEDEVGMREEEDEKDGNKRKQGLKK